MKLLLLGLSGSGKSTTALKLSEKYKLDLLEADDEVQKYNGGVWPDSDEIITKVFEETNKKAINLDDVIYVTSWMEQSVIKGFFDKGFKIFEMHADFDELVRRKRIRDNATDDKIKRFELTYTEYFNTILPVEMTDSYTLSIDSTSREVNEIVEMIETSLNIK